MDVLKKFRVDESLAEGNLSSNQKLAITGLALLGILIIFLWGVGMKNNIYQPLATRKVPEQMSVGTLSEEERQKTQDTDGDGLTDWNELNVFLTSPYIDDTDSDGVNDGVEVQSRQDPNCPRGQDCGRSSVLSDSSSEDDSSSAVVPVIEAGLEGVGLTQEQAKENEGDLNKVFGGQADAATLRKLLLESGVKKEILDQMTDEQLMTGYLSTLQSAVEGQ